jgi:glycosyltransferase involved in cell wall biosynthesis
VSEEQFAILECRYLSVTSIPYFVDEAGRILLDDAWHHDLVQHLAYLPRFILAAPCRPAPAQRLHLLPLADDLRAKIEVVPLPAPASRVSALVTLPATAARVWRAVGRAEIVHAGVAGWPYPMGWLAIPMARMRRKKIVVIVESAPWRCPAHSKLTLRKRLEASLYEWLARRGCRAANLSFYTQAGYREQLHGRGRGPAFVAPATWINVEDVLDDNQAARAWDEKMNQPVRFLFAGRLVVEKGVEVLLAAARILEEAGACGALDLIGDGPLRATVAAAVRGGRFSVSHFEPIDSGKPFLDFLQRYHVAVIPSLTDEQPRIVFDAAARAVAVLASDTDGLRPHVENGTTGLLVPPGDPKLLAQAMMEMARVPSRLRTMAAEALRRVRGRTHRAMHAERSRLLAQHLL